MTNTIERLRTVGIGRQGTFDSGVASNYWLRKLSFEEGRNSEHLNDESAIGNTAETSGAQVSRTWAEPQLSTYLDLAPQGLIEFANCESYAVTTNADVSTDVFDHVFKVGTSTMGNNYLTLNTDDPTQGDQRFLNALINSISMTFATNAKVNTDIGLVAGYPGAEAATPAIVTPQYFMGRHITVSLDDTVSDFDANSLFGATNVSFERTNNVDTGETTAFELGRLDIKNHRMQSRSASLTISKVQNDNTFVAMDLGATKKALKIEIVDTATTIGTAANPKYTITFPLCTVKTAPSGDNNSRRTEELSVTPHYGLDNAESESYLYKVQITNLVPTYATI